MLKRTEANNIGSIAVRELRFKKLSNGLPFMLNSLDLPSEQCYLEYPDGSIKLVRISKNTSEFITIKELTQKEISFIRIKFQLV